jgi:hypothetical protein
LTNGATCPIIEPEVDSPPPIGPPGGILLPPGGQTPGHRQRRRRKLIRFMAKLGDGEITVTVQNGCPERWQRVAFISKQAPG